MNISEVIFNTSNNNTMSDNNCTANNMLAAGLGLLFIFSEILPYIKKLKSNGLTECLTNTVKDYKNKNSNTK